MEESIPSQYKIRQKQKIEMLNKVVAETNCLYLIDPYTLDKKMSFEDIQLLLNDSSKLSRMEQHCVEKRRNLIRLQEEANRQRIEMELLAIEKERLRLEKKRDFDEERRHQEILINLN